MIERKDIKNENTNGFRTLISNGKRHFIIDTCYTLDKGNESMVFETREFSTDDKYIRWEDLDSICGFSTSEMESKHNKMVQKWTEKLEREETNVIEFVSYDGSFPNLCRGTLVIKVNGKEYNCGRCLMSGGSVTFDDHWAEHIGEGDWSIDKDCLPKEIAHLYKEIADVVNANVPQGCCGGCV